MLAELQGKGGCLCQPAKEGQLRCPLIVRSTSEDVITGHVFQVLRAVNPRYWLSQMLNASLGTSRFRQQCFRDLKIKLWSNQPAYPRELLPWREGSTQVDVVIEWENPPTTVFVEAKYRAGISLRTSGDDGQSGFPSDQLTRNLRVGLFQTGYFQRPGLFTTTPRDFVLILLSPTGQHELVSKYRNPVAVLAAIPHSDLIGQLPRSPFVGHLTYAAMQNVLQMNRSWMSRTERMLVADLIEYLEFKLSALAVSSPLERQLLLNGSSRHSWHQVALAGDEMANATPSPG